MELVSDDDMEISPGGTFTVTCDGCETVWSIEFRYNEVVPEEDAAEGEGNER